jgi:hypothetical protein
MILVLGIAGAGTAFPIVFTEEVPWSLMALPIGAWTVIGSVIAYFSIPGAIWTSPSPGLATGAQAVSARIGKARDALEALGALAGRASPAVPYCRADWHPCDTEDRGIHLRHGNWPEMSETPATTPGRTAVGLVFLAGVFALLAFAYLWPWHAAANRCRIAYASARTAADTAVVDTIRMAMPTMSRNLATLSQTERCDALVRAER